MADNEMKFSSMTNPLDTANVFQKLLFNWINPLIKLGAKRPLEHEDIYPLPLSHLSMNVYQLVNQGWLAEVKKNKEKAFLRNTVFSLYWKWFICSCLAATIYIVVIVLQPFFVDALLQYVADKRTNLIGIKSGVGIAILLAALSLIAQIALNYAFYLAIRISIFMRSAIILMVFNKSLKLSSASKSKHTTGEIVTLMSVDSERLVQGILLGFWVYIGPSMIILATVLLILQVQYAAIAGAGTLIVISYGQHYLAQMTGRIRRKLVSCTDTRVKVMNETLQGVRVVKLYAWEEPIAKRIDVMRKAEVSQIEHYQLLKILNGISTLSNYLILITQILSMFIGPLLVQFAVILAYVTTGGEISVAKIYTIYAIINIVRMPLAILPMAFNAIAEMNVSFVRLTKFLLLDEIEELQAIEYKPPNASTTTSANVNNNEMISTNLTTLITNNSHEKEDAIVNIVNANFSWSDHSTDQVSLKGLNFTVHPGEFIGIVGTVGSGKSSLLSAILGQMHRITGTQILKGKVAYVSQEHWIQNRSLRDNILFDSPWNEIQYHQVVQAAQLSQDFLSLPSGDGTEIGERGINLSGGQKARVSIARALYANDIDLYIFDDPLSAVDAHVGRALFEGALTKMLVGKARLVVMSSNYHLLPLFERILVVENGEITADGTYSNVIESHPQYRSVEDVDEDEQDNTYNNGDDQLVDVTINEEEEEEAVANQTLINHHANMEPLILEELGNSELKYSLPGTNTSRKNSVTSSTHNSVNGTSSRHNSVTERPNKEIAGVSLKIIEKNEVGLSMIKAEDRERGAVTMMTYVKYFGAAVSSTPDNEVLNGVLVFLAILSFFAVGQTIRVYADYWGAFWAQDYEDSYATQKETFYIRWYIVIVVGVLVIGLLRSYSYIRSALNSSRNLHNVAFKSVLAAPINTYFDVTPMGRILNRFSKDMDSMDSLLPDSFLQNLQNGMYVLSIFAICIISSYYFVIIMIPVMALFIAVQNFFRKTSRELKRLEGVTRSPVYSMFEELLQGISTIRAYGRQELFLKRQCEATDKNTECYFLFWIASRWISLRLDFVSICVMLAVSLLAVCIVEAGGAINAGVLGLALVYSLQLTGLLQWTVRMVVDTENNMTAVERILAFTHLESEAPNTLDTDPSLKEWPVSGSLSIRNLSMRYRPGLNLVLKNLYLDIPGGSKVGVCGRTGSGKSSLMLALFRVVEPELTSQIYVDDVDILSVGLRSLRSSLTIIPQDPVMFSGTLRYNLDPFNVFTDEELWQALDRAQLKDDILAKFPDKLQHAVSERGENVSVGQRQLLCIARALLRRSKIIVMDEATASVDSVTDAKIQTAVRREFHHCTVLTIAHRLETIADSDIIVVMAEGSIAEQGNPKSLLEKESGLFRALVDELGPERRAAILQSTLTIVKMEGSIN